ncbi:hypothetical protein J7337_013157 [Fusarium musae]|uniref:Uncharacterized protein n=1 Tax=Fusarium musae TaxID=1042133 RepID=A0A9P8D411_9HYPO|nr:hypothetical protein J7337_013157 [Fusarium musae]KAG9494928.1 hypothetical protein J7337_013157 [Fusarium musae]
MEAYAGPGARMLSNLRFNVLMPFTTMPATERKCLLLRLTPRSHKGWIRMQDVQEMTFMLTLAQLSSFAGNKTFSFYTSAYYKFDHKHDPITDYFKNMEQIVQDRCLSGDVQPFYGTSSYTGEVLFLLQVGGNDFIFWNALGDSMYRVTRSLTLETIVAGLDKEGFNAFDLEEL